MQHLASVFRWFLDGNQNSGNFKKLPETLIFHWLTAIKKRLVESHVQHALCVLLAGRQVGQGGLDRQLQELQYCPVFCAIGLRPSAWPFLTPCRNMRGTMALAHNKNAEIAKARRKCMARIISGDKGFSPASSAMLGECKQSQKMAMQGAMLPLLLDLSSAQGHGPLTGWASSGLG